MKTCTKCELDLPLSLFYKKSDNKDGFFNQCRKCLLAKQKIWLASLDPEHKAIRNNKQRDAYFKLKFGISLEERDKIIKSQGGRCAICSLIPTNMDLDHNHETGQIRSFLCNQCNQGIGLFKDDPKLLEAAAGYLRSFFRPLDTLSKEIYESN